LVFAVPSDHNPEPEEHPRRIKEANDALKRFQELLNGPEADRDKDELERLRRKVLSLLAPPKPKVSQAPRPPPPFRGISLRPARYRLVLPLANADDLPPAGRDEIMLAQMEAVDMSPKDGIVHVMGPYIAHAHKQRRQKGWSADKALGWLRNILQSIASAQNVDFLDMENILLRYGVLRDVIALWVGSPPPAPAENKEPDSANGERPAAPPETAISTEQTETATPAATPVSTTSPVAPATPVPAPEAPLPSKPGEPGSSQKTPSHVALAPTAPSAEAEAPTMADPSADPPAAVKSSELKGRRGRPEEIPPERKERALKKRNELDAQGKKNNRAIAQILYDTRNPTPEQNRSVSTILRHYEKSLKTGLFIRGYLFEGCG
jgi:hypothetical protein